MEDVGFRIDLRLFNLGIFQDVQDLFEITRIFFTFSYIT